MDNRAWLLSGLAALQSLHCVYAQTPPPDAGRLEQRPRPAAPATEPAPKVVINPGHEAAPAAQAAITEGTLMVSGFRFSGDLAGIDPARLQAQVAGQGGKVYALSQLHQVADMVERYLQAELGLIVAKAWVPLQDVQRGIVEIRVLQGTVENIKAGGTLPAAALAVAVRLLPPGAPLSRARLEESVYRMSDYAGAQVRAVLVPAPVLGHYDVQFEKDGAARVSGSISVDNGGNRYTSRWHETLNVKIADLTGHSDQLQLASQLLTPRQRSVHLHYVLPLPGDFRLGVSAQGSRYDLGGKFSAIDAHGDTVLGGMDLQRAFIRSRELNVYGRAEMLRRRLRNYYLGSLYSEHTVDEMTLGARADWTSGAAFHYGWLTVSSGYVSLDGSAVDAPLDRPDAHVAGSYNKAAFGYTRTQTVTPRDSVVLNVSGQWASKNLDSSETFLLGGMAAVRAYPAGEAAGDQSLTAQLEWHRTLGKVRYFAFYDAGWITLHKSPWPAFTGRNNVHLQGIGLGAVWRPREQTELSLIMARKLGRNPLADPLTGNDSDGRASHYRLWAYASQRF